MKVAVFILLSVFSFLTIQPVIAATMVKSEHICCFKEKQKKEDCSDKTCNPFKVCATGSFQIINNSVDEVVLSFPQKHTIRLINDKRLSSSLTECWHPPRIA